MNRVTITMDERVGFVRICADEEVEVYIVCLSIPRDRVYRWSPLHVGPEYVDEEIGARPVGDRDNLPTQH